MAEEPQAIRGINWRDTFPFTNLFRTFRIAIHPSKLGLALLALLVFYIGGRIFDLIWWMLGYPAVFMPFLNYEAHQINLLALGVLALNPEQMLFAIWSFIALGPLALVRNHPVFAFLLILLFLCVWSIFGGAISRIAAVHVARDEKISVRQAIRFSIGKFLSFLFAPLIPLLIVVVIGLVLAAGGALLYIPWIGPILVGALFFLALLAGCIITLVLIGTIGGFNLMYPTIAVEGSDSFDAISRSFSYVYARPWRMLFYTLVAVIYGALTYLFVRLFVFVLLAVTHYFVGLLLWGQPNIYWHGLGDAAAMWPPPDLFALTYPIAYEGLKWSESIAATLIAFWVYLVIGILGAFIISFYFSANTVIYYLMRREVDATELDDVYIEQADEEFLEPAPVTSAEPPAGEQAPSKPQVIGPATDRAEADKPDAGAGQNEPRPSGDESRPS
jgi:hypothetical protein